MWTHTHTHVTEGQPGKTQEHNSLRASTTILGFWGSNSSPDAGKASALPNEPSPACPVSCRGQW